jgi:LAO/AO transport system kinase
VSQARSSHWKEVLAGDVRAASRLIRDIEDRQPHTDDALRALFPFTGRAYVLGVTGPPGAGKSTLVDRLISHFRGLGKSVGVLAVDPTSPFTGGAILGDRVRMQGHALDSGVFIRSMATRGHWGGLARATSDCVHVLDAMGRNTIVVETVGVGQGEIEVAALAHTTVVVLVPGMGDEVQAIKAGILEAADVFVVNKADRPGAEKLTAELLQMLELREAVGSGRQPSDWEPPVVQVVATQGTGMAELAQALAKHRAYLAGPAGKSKAFERARAHLLLLLRERVVESAMANLERKNGNLDALVRRIAEHQADPYEAVNELVLRMAGES